GAPDPELLRAVALRAGEQQGFTAAQLAGLAARVEAAAAAGTLVSIREAERLAVRQYVENLLGQATAARIGAGPPTGGSDGASRPSYRPARPGLPLIPARARARWRPPRWGCRARRRSAATYSPRARCS